MTWSADGLLMKKLKNCFSTIILIIYIYSFRNTFSKCGFHTAFEVIFPSDEHRNAKRSNTSTNSCFVCMLCEHAVHSCECGSAHKRCLVSGKQNVCIIHDVSHQSLPVYITFFDDTALHIQSASTRLTSFTRHIFHSRCLNWRSELLAHALEWISVVQGRRCSKIII